MKFLEVKYRPVNIALAALVVTNGSCLRITIPAKQARAFDIRPGDEITFSITGVKREEEQVQ